SALYQGFGPSSVSTIYAPTAQYKVLLELLPEYQEHPDALSMLYLKSPQGSLVPLTAVTKLGRDAGPLTINHSGQLPSVTIAFNLRPGFALGDAVSQVKELADRTLPPRVTRQLHRNCPGVSELAEEPAAAYHHRRPCGLHRRVVTGRNCLPFSGQFFAD